MGLEVQRDFVTLISIIQSTYFRDNNIADIPQGKKNPDYCSFMKNTNK